MFNAVSPRQQSLSRYERKRLDNDIELSHLCNGGLNSILYKHNRQAFEPCVGGHVCLRVVMSLSALRRRGSTAAALLGALVMGLASTGLD